MLQIPIFIQIRDSEINQDSLLHNTKKAFHLGLPTRHEIGEIMQVAMIIEIANFFKVKTIIQGVTEKRAVELILQAKKTNNIFLEISIPHLIFNDEIYSNFNNYAKINPPFQSQENLEFLQETFINGQIDFLTTLHREISESNKNGSFIEASNGIFGLDFPLSILFTKFVDSGLMSKENFFKFFNKNNLKIGEKASFSLFNIEKNVTINNKYSLYFEKRLKGDIILSISKGVIFRFGI
jgi:dihydroorotase